MTPILIKLFKGFVLIKQGIISLLRMMFLPTVWAGMGNDTGGVNCNHQARASGPAGFRRAVSAPCADAWWS